MKTKESPWKTVAEGLVRYQPSGTYFAYYRVDGKPVRQSLKTDDLATARRLLAKRKAAPPKPRTPEITVEEACERFLNSMKRYSESSQNLAKIFCKRITAAFPNRTISTLRGSDIENLLGSRIEDGFSKSSYNEELRNARKLFTLAVHDGFLEKNPIAYVKQLKRDKPHRDTPSEEEFTAIVEIVRQPVKEPQKGKHGGQRPLQNDESADFIEFMGKAGVGNSEAAALKWKNVDFEKGVIRLYRNKTDKGFTIPLFPSVRPILERLWEKGDKPPDSRVFKIENARKALANACKRLQFPNYTQRSLRRLFITKCLYKNVPVPTVGAWQGHTDNGATILRNYSQIIASKDKALAEQIT